MISYTGGSANVFGRNLTPDSPTAIFVQVITEILKAHPEIIGQKETHFTTDKSRADRYTGTTREVLINGSTVYIKTGFSTKDKIKGIEKICQLAGISFSLFDTVDSDDNCLKGFDYDIFADDSDDMDFGFDTVFPSETAEEDDFFNDFSFDTPFENPEESVKAIHPVAKQTETSVNQSSRKKSIEEIMTSTMQKMMLTSMIMKSPIPSKATIYAKHENDYELNKFYKDIKTLNNGIKVGCTIEDDLGDLVLKQYKTPKGKEQLLKDSIPVYEISHIGKVNAYTFLKVSVSDSLYKYYLIYAKNNKIYMHDIMEELSAIGDNKINDIEICDCNNVVSILAARELLLVTEISDFRYVGRTDHESQMGDFGYTSDDYKATLQLRVLNMAGNELIKVDNTNSIISAMPCRYKDTKFGKQMSLLFVTDFNHNCYGLKNNASEPNIYEPERKEWSSFETAWDKDKVLKENDINYSQYFKLKNNIIMLAPETTIVWNDEHKKIFAYDTKEFFKEGK